MGFMMPKSLSLSQAHNCLPSCKCLQLYNEDITLYSSYRKWERDIVIRASRLGLYYKLKNLVSVRKKITGALLK